MLLGGKLLVLHNNTTLTVDQAGLMRSTPLHYSTTPDPGKVSRSSSPALYWV
jgi:hypothetical protein